MANNATAESPEPDLSNVTGPEALSQARESGQAVAVTAEYTKTTQIFANPDGTFTAEIASGPVQIPSTETETGWEDIDTTLADTGGIVEPEAAAAVIEFSDGGDAELASLATGTRQFGMDWTSTLPAPSLSGDTATYPDVLPGIDLTLQARPQGFEQNLVVAEPPTEPLVVQLPLELKGLSATVDADGQMVMTDPTGKPVMSADPARMWGAVFDPVIDEPTVQALVDTRIVNTASGPKLEIAPDPSFFATPGLTYPVTIDPTPDLSVDKDTYVDSSQPTVYTFRNETLLKSGSPNGSAKTRSYITFAGVGTLSGKYINNAILKLYETYAASCTNTTVSVFAANSAITTTTTWNNQPGQGAKYAEVTTSKGCSAGNEGTVNFSDGGANGKTMTDLVQSWANGSANNGVRIEAGNETNSAAYKKFKSSESSNNVPVLAVNYTSYPAPPTGLSATTDSSGVTTFHGGFSDPDGGGGFVVFSLTDPLGESVLDSAWGAFASSGTGTSSFALHDYVLSPGSYTITAQASDGNALSTPISQSVTIGSPSLPPSTPRGLIPEDQSVVSGPDQVLSAMFEDPNPGTGNVRFNVYNVAGQLVDAQGLPSNQSHSAIGATGPSSTSGHSSWSAAVVHLPAAQYTVTASASDGTLVSAETEPNAFTVAGLPPTPPAITVPGVSSKQLALVFAQPIDVEQVDSLIGQYAPAEVNITYGSPDETSGLDADGITVGAALDAAIAQHGNAPVTSLLLTGGDGDAPFTIPTQLSRLAASAEVIDKTPIPEGDNPDEEGTTPSTPPGISKPDGEPRSGYGPWVPVRGETYGVNLGKPKRATMFHWFVAADGDGFTAHDAYEHNFNLKWTGPSCDDPHFWAKHPVTYWKTNMPDAYYDDADASDDHCRNRDFTVGTYFPTKFKQGKDYYITVQALRDNRPSSPFVLEAQKLYKHCHITPWCVGLEEWRTESWLLVGKDNGVIPGCRAWWRAYPSDDC